MAYMKVWRGISLGLWSVTLTVLLLICTVYFLVSNTLLDEVAVTKQLDSSRVYGVLRTEVVIPAITDQITRKSDPNSLISPDVITKSLSSSLSETDVKTISQPMLDALYGWLNKKRPDPNFSVSIAAENEQFLASLKDTVKQKLTSLPVCAMYYVDEATLVRGECLPQYTTVDVALDEVMTQVRVQATPFGTEISDQTVGLSSKQLGDNANIPDYLSYLWTLNLIALPLAGLSILYLLIKFGGTGAIVIGSVLVLLGAGLLGAYLLLRSIQLPTEIIQRTFSQAGQTLLLGELWPLALIGLGSGLLGISLGVMWQIHRGKPSQQDEVSTETIEPTEELPTDLLPTEKEKPKLEKRPLGRK